MTASVQSVVSRGGPFGTTSWTHDPVAATTGIIVVCARNQQYHDMSAVAYGGLALGPTQSCGGVGGSTARHLCIWTRTSIAGRSDNIVRTTGTYGNYWLYSILINDAASPLASSGKTNETTSLNPGVSLTGTGIAIAAGVSSSALGSLSGQTGLVAGSYYPGRSIRIDSKPISVSGTVGFTVSGSEAAALFGDIVAAVSKSRAFILG